MAAIPLTSCNETSPVISLFQLLKRKREKAHKNHTENSTPHTTSSPLGCRRFFLPINKAG